MKQELEAEGLDNLALWFMQIGTIQASSSALEDYWMEKPIPVLQDDSAQTVWNAYASSWYEAVLIDPEGCTVAHLGPFGTGEVPAEELRSLWRDVALDQWDCPDRADSVEPVPDMVEPGPDVLDARSQPDTISDVGSDAQFDTMDTDLAGDLPQDTPPTDTTGDAPTDTTGDAPTDTTSDSSGPLACQVPGGPADPQPGEPVPWFSCQDVNPFSPTQGQLVSPAILKEQVWIVLTGSST